MDILLVEDEQLVRKIISTALQDFGFSVEEADSGDAAWEKIERGCKFELLITDVRMPGDLDGLDLASRVRVARPRSPVIIMSAYCGARNPSSFGFDNFLPKPFTQQQLAQLIQSVLPADAAFRPPQADPHAR